MVDLNKYKILVLLHYEKMFSCQIKYNEIVKKEY